MINPITFLWKQLNGPQIMGITKALHSWLQGQFGSLVDYFRNLRIDTASSEHLSLFGQIANLARPFVSIPDKNFFWFTAEPQKNFEHGFSTLDERGIGGKFIDLQKILDTHHGEPLTDEFYRLLLKTYTNSEGEVGSLALLDDIVYALKNKYASAGKVYTFIIQEEVKTNRDKGDIVIDLGTEDTWNAWEQVIVTLQAIGGTLYAPLPRIFAEFTEEDPSTYNLEGKIEGNNLVLTGDGVKIENGTLKITADNAKIENGKLTINN